MPLVRLLRSSPDLGRAGEEREVSPEQARQMVKKGDAERIIVRQERIERT